MLRDYEFTFISVDDETHLSDASAKRQTSNKQGPMNTKRQRKKTKFDPGIHPWTL